MPILSALQKYNLAKERAQAIVEFAIVLPILLMMLVGILEVGRMVFIYAAVNNASREAARYASAVGLANDGVHTKFNYCAGIREVARQSAFLMTLQDTDIDIEYDKGPSTSPHDYCPIVVSDPNIAWTSGDRVTVTVRATYEPMVNLIPIGSRDYEATSSRTIVGVFELASDPGGAGSGGGGGSGATKTATSTVAASSTPTNTSSAGSPVPPTDTATSTPTALWVYTLTPVDTATASSEPTGTATQPSNTPKPSHTPKPSNTPRPK